MSYRYGDSPDQLIPLRRVRPRGTCPHCKDTVELVDGLVAYHDYPKPCRSVCRGSKRAPLAVLKGTSDA